ncbi:hypothetical protein C8J56DRAFT_1063175 [Mycena floridula]|nr:hypothetical protein C8J56DRAFT_1063175 [Mycena floridula]
MTGSIARISIFVLAFWHCSGTLAAPLGYRDGSLDTHRLDSGDLSLDRRIIPPYIAIKLIEAVAGNEKVQSMAISGANNVGLPGDKMADMARQAAPFVKPAVAVASFAAGGGVIMGLKMAADVVSKNPQVQQAAMKAVDKLNLPGTKLGEAIGTAASLAKPLAKVADMAMNPGDAAATAKLVAELAKDPAVQKAIKEATKAGVPGTKLAAAASDTVNKVTSVAKPAAAAVGMVKKVVGRDELDIREVESIDELD